MPSLLKFRFRVQGLFRVADYIIKGNMLMKGTRLRGPQGSLGL